MSLITRLKRLEGKVVNRPCPVCFTWQGLVLFGDAPAVRASPCPRCGQSRYVLHGGKIAHPFGEIIYFLMPGARIPAEIPYALEHAGSNPAPGETGRCPRR